MHIQLAVEDLKIFHCFVADKTLIIDVTESF